MRIAVSNPDNIGDFVVRQPMLAALAAAGHELLLIVRAHVAPLAAWAMPGATIVQCVADPYQPSFQVDAAPDDRVIKAVTAFDPDIFVVASFQHTQLEEQLAQHLPRAKAIGFGGELFQNDKSRNITHVPAMNLAVQVQVGRDWLESRKNEVLAGAILGTSVTLPPPRLTADKGFLTAAAGRLRQQGFAKRKFWIVCAGEGSAYTRLKNWSLEKWAEVCTTMVRDHGLHLIFVGTPSEHETTAAIRAQMGEFAGKTLDMTTSPDGLDMLVGLTALADGYLGKDTGPMHIAAALGKPVVAVFGGGHWPRFLPAPASGKVLSVQVPCSDCNWICPYKHSYCVKNIPVDAVQDAIRAVLSGQQKDFEVALLEPDPWVARAMVLDAADTARDAMRALEAERANFHQWHSDRVRDIEGLRQDLIRLETEKDAHARHELQSAVAKHDQELARINEHSASLDSDRVTLQRLLTQRDSDLLLLTDRATLSVTQAEIARKQSEELSAVVARQAANQADLEGQLLARQTELAAIQNQHTTLQHQHAALQHQHTALQQQLTDLQARLTARDDAFTSLTILSTAATNELDSLRAELASLRHVLDANQVLERRFARFHERTARQILEYKTRIADFQQQEAALPELATLREENKRLDLECADRAAALDAARASLDQVESRYQGTVADLRQQLRRSEDQLRSVLTLVPDLRDELARSLTEVARIPGIEQDQADKQSLIEQLTASIETIEADRADRLVLINTLSSRLAAVEADQCAKQEVIDNLLAELSSATAAIEDLQQLLALSESALAQSESAHALSESAHALSESALALSESAHAQSESALKEKEELVARGETVIADLNQRTTELQLHIDALTRQSTALSQQIAALTRQNGALNQQIAEIESDRDARLQLIKRLSAELAAIDADRANRGRQIEVLHAHIEHQQAEIAKIEASLLPRRLVNLFRKN